MEQLITDTSLLLQAIYYTKPLMLTMPLGLEKEIVEKLLKVVLFIALIYARVGCLLFRRRHSSE